MSESPVLFERHHYAGIFQEVEKGAILPFDPREVDASTTNTPQRGFIDIAGFNVCSRYSPGEEAKVELERLSRQMDF